jgi:acetyltransferase-like isoleucine patch superfamily enzyme
MSDWKTLMQSAHQDFELKIFKTAESIVAFKKLITGNNSFESPISIDIKGTGNVYSVSNSSHLSGIINFYDSSGSVVIIDKGVKGKVHIKMRGNNSFLYIGRDGVFHGMDIRSTQESDFIAVGAKVTVTSNLIIISGQGSGNANPSVIIGDDCMFSNNVTIRSTDSHPVYDVNSLEQLNMPFDDVHIEPHVWLGEKVTILKNVRVGACSIVGLGSVVTRSVPRFSKVAGVPAKSKSNASSFWARNSSEIAKKSALNYHRAYVSKITEEG